MDLSITIVSYNSCQVTLRALESIHRETHGIEYEIIVVDNASTDNSAEMIAAKFPEVRLIRSDRNLGFAAAHNRALAVAGGKFFMVLNSDVLFVNNVAWQMVSRLRASRPEIGVIGPQILNPDGTLATSARRQIIYSRLVVTLTTINQTIPFIKVIPVDFIRRHFNNILGRVHDNFSPPDSAQEVAWVDGMCLMFKRGVLEQSGLFDEQFFFDFEIGDLLMRVSAKGWRILFDPAIRIIHFGGYSRKQASRIMIESQRSELIYYAKYRPDYIPMLRYVNLIRFWLEITSMRLKSVFLLQPASCNEKIEILKEARKVVSEFNPGSVWDNERIPRLAKTGGGNHG